MLYSQSIGKNPVVTKHARVVNLVAAHCSLYPIVLSALVCHEHFAVDETAYIIHTKIFVISWHCMLQKLWRYV